MTKKFLSFIWGLLVTSTLWSQNPGDTLILNLNQPVNPTSFQFDADGKWVETYNGDDYPFIELNSPFSFSHLISGDSWGGYYWDGFTVCNSGDNANYGGGSSGGWVAKQWGCMAGGGIKTDFEGKIMKDASGRVQVENGIPYLLAYWGFMDPEAVLQTIFTDGNTYEAVGVYVNNSPWPYYGNINGDGFTRALDQEGDYFKLIFHGLDADFEDNGITVEHYLAKFENGQLIQSPDWEWVDLSALGEIGGLYYTMESTDAGSFGINTAVYFCLDKLQIRIPEIQPTNVMISQTSAELIVGESLQLTATVMPEDVTNQNVYWESDNESIATVSANGLVTAIAAGSVNITVKTAAGGLTAVCAITVSRPVTVVSLNRTSAELVIGENLQLIATITPEDASDPNVSWESDNESVATVSADGLVTAIATGSANITVKTADGGLTAVCAVTVRIPVTSVSLNVTSAKLVLGENLQLTATVTPENASNPNVSWESDNESVATVSADGLVTAIATGSANITVKTADGGLTAVCAVTVRIPVTSVSLNVTSAELVVNESLKLVATVTPEDASDRNVSWESDNKSVAAVTDRGLVMAIAAGSAKITVKTADGELTAVCQITVTKNTDIKEVKPNTFISQDLSSESIIINSFTEGLVTIYNVSGHTVLSRKVNIGHNRISTSLLPKGIYIARFGEEVLKFRK